MKNPAIAIGLAALALLVPTPGFSQGGDGQGHGRAVVTILPKKEGTTAPSVRMQNLSVTVNGKPARVTSWTPLEADARNLEVVILIDGSARGSLSSQFADIANFVKSLPRNSKAAIAYMANGRAVFAAPFSADPAVVLRALHLPGGLPGGSASPYFCLSDLAKNWPSRNSSARREVLMITDGVDYYHLQFDPDDPYVQSAIQDSVHAGLVVDSIYWLNRGFIDRTDYENNAGQNLLSEVTGATGGESFWYGTGNPVSLKPYLDKISNRLRNQYELGFEGRLEGKSRLAFLKLKLSLRGAKAVAPEQVMLSPIALPHSVNRP